MAGRKEDNYKIVAALDIGTSFSGYAFSFTHEYKKSNRLRITTNQWTGEGVWRPSEKAPTVVLLDPNMSFHSFGYEAETKFTQLAEDGEDRSWYYLKEFKMTLYKKPIDEHLLLSDIQGMSVPAVPLFSQTIRYLVNHLLKTLQTRGLDYKMDDILFVVTVPAIWRDAAKQFMRKAANMAGIKPEHLRLAFEPEAAALFCQHLPPEQLNVKADSSHLFLMERKFIVVDLGGGTTDVAVLKVGRDGLHQVRGASGGGCGGCDVNREFRLMLNEIFGESFLKSYCQDNMVDFLEMCRDFEMKKRNVSSDQTDTKIYIPMTLVEYCKERRDTIHELLLNSIYADKIKCKRGKLVLDRSICINFFTKVLARVVTHIQVALKDPNCNGVDLMIVVGGFAESPFVMETMKARFPDLKVIIPLSAGTAVLKGAVLYGHDSSAIASRACPLTYGVAINKLYIPGVHPISKTFKVNSRLKARDCFEKMFTVNEVLKPNSVRSFDVYNTYREEGQQTSRKEPKQIELFSSPFKDPIFVTDNKCRLHGVLTVPPPTGEWPVESEGRIEVELGGTEFIVRYIDLATNAEVSGSIDFNPVCKSDDEESTEGL